MRNTILQSAKLLVFTILGCWGWAILPVTSAQQSDAADPTLSVKQIMNAIITPATTIIWGAYQLQTEAEWQAIENAAMTLLTASHSLRGEGLNSAEEKQMATNSDWQQFNDQMIAATRTIIAAVSSKDEEALSAAGNDLLYPPCESCHQKYQAH